MPDDVAEALRESSVCERYHARPAYQQNDYLRWIGQAKREATRDKRLHQMIRELESGDVYMGMPYSTKKQP